MAVVYLNGLEYLEDDLGMLDFDETEDAGFGFNMHDHLHEDLHAELLDYFDYPERQQNDTSATEYRNGKDMQGIPWERLNYTRDGFRTMRFNRYQNFESLSVPRDSIKKEWKKVQRENKFYDFQFNTRLAKTTIVHFQLRNLLWATSKHDVYMVYNYSIMHWSSLLQESKELLNVSGPVVPTQKSCGSSTLNRVQICTMAVQDDLLAAGGFRGELICKHLNQPGAIFCTKLTEDDNAITNSVDIAWSPSGAGRVICGNNDCLVRVLDTEKFSLLNHFPFSWSVNSTSVGPDCKLLAVLEDSTDCIIADSQTGKVVSTLKGHLDYSFSCAWHPAGHIIATGNQDTTCRLWDVRYPSEALAVLKGNMSAIRGIKFSSDGNFMAMAEAADYIHVYDAKANYSSAQEMDLFGEISGISFSPDFETRIVGLEEDTSEGGGGDIEQSDDNSGIIEEEDDDNSGIIVEEDDGDEAVNIEGQDEDVDDQEDVILRRSTRQHRPPTRLQYFVTYKVQYPIENFISYENVSKSHSAFIASTEKLEEPTTFNEAKNNSI